MKLKLAIIIFLLFAILTVSAVGTLSNYTINSGSNLVEMSPDIEKIELMHELSNSDENLELMLDDNDIPEETEVNQNEAIEEHYLIIEDLETEVLDEDLQN